MGDVGEPSDVGHEELRIGDDFEEQGAGLVVNQRLHLLGLREVGKARLYPEVSQRVADERDRVAEEMLRGHDVQSCRADSRQGVVDGGHAGVECRHAGGARQLAHTLLQIGDGRVGDAGVRRRHGATAKRVAHGLGRLKLKRRRIVDGHRQCPVSVWLLILRRQYFRFVFHNSLSTTNFTNFTNFATVLSVWQFV